MLFFSTGNVNNAKPTNKETTISATLNRMPRSAPVI